MRQLKGQGFLLIIMLFIFLGEAQGQNFFTQNTTTGLPTYAYKFDVADVENDGDLDILISDFDVVHIYTNDGSGNFTQLTGTAFSNVTYYYANTRFIDIDGDNDQDVVIISYAFNGTPTSQLYRNDGGSTFTQINTFPSVDMYDTQIAVGDIDGDNDEDMIITGQIPSAISSQQYSAFYNDGNGNFSTTLSYNTQLWNQSFNQIPIIEKMDNDNIKDIMVARYDGLSFNFAVRKSSNYSTVYPLLGSSGTVYNSNGIPADVDGDGDNDIIGNIGVTNYIALNDGFANFTLSSQTFNAGLDIGLIAAGDIDNDGDVDFLRTGQNATLNGYLGGIYMNDGTGYFYENTALSIKKDVLYGQAKFVDLNGDNYPELLICNEANLFFYDNTHTTNHPKKALDFDGTNYYTANHDAALNTLPMTIELKVQDAATGPGGLLKKLSGNNGFHLGVNHGYFYAHYSTDASNLVISNQAYQLTANEWVHLAVVVETTGMKLYVNGVEHSTSNWTGTAGAISNTVGLELGTWGLTTDKFSGNLDEVRIWNTVRTQAEIVNNMCDKISNPANEANLVAYYSMDDYVSGNNVMFDESSNKNTATITGGTQVLAAEQVGCTAPVLPVELTFFIGRLENNTAVLNWQTASEENNYGFEVQSSFDGENWENIGFVNGNGTTTAISNYEFTHDLSFENLSGLYYRLKQIDFDDNYEYSNIVNITITRNSQPATRISPNPTTDFINIETNQIGEIVQLIDVTGQVIKEFQLQETTNQYPVTSLPNGIYFLKTGKTVEKVIIQH